MVFNRSLDCLKLKTSFFAFVASPILTSITFWKQAFKTAALFVQSSLFENLLLKKFSRVIVVYCSIIKVLFAVLFKRQLLYFIKSFSLCQELFYFLLLLVSCSIASLWQLIYVITSELLCQPLFNNSYKLLLISLMNHSIELSLDQGVEIRFHMQIWNQRNLWCLLYFLTIWRKKLYELHEKYEKYKKHWQLHIRVIR